jgi:uncharacterized protein
MRANLEHNPRVCLMSINSSGMFWAASLYKGKFSSAPGIRLIGVAGELRVATQEEKAAYLARVKPFRKLKGCDLLWTDLNHVREIKLEGFEPVVYPKMMDHLWT